MFLYFIHVVSPLAGLLISAVIQIVVYRYIKKLGLLKTLFIGFIGGLFALFIIEIIYFFPGKDPTTEIIGQLILNMISFIALEYCYLHFINLGETARRVRIIREILDSKTGLSMSDLLERYNSSIIINARLNRLIKNKQIVYQDKRYFTNNSIMLYIAKTIFILKLFLLKRGRESL